MKEEKKNRRIFEEEKYPRGRNSGGDAAIPGINTPGIELPAFNPPIPNRAWTAMRQGRDIDELSPEEKRDLYFGKDNYL